MDEIFYLISYVLPGTAGPGAFWIKTVTIATGKPIYKDDQDDLEDAVRREEKLAPGTYVQILAFSRFED